MGEEIIAVMNQALREGKGEGGSTLLARKGEEHKEKEEEEKNPSSQMLQEAQVDVSLSTHMLQPCQDESSCDTDSDSCLENTQSGGESIRDTSSAHESSGELSSVPTPPKAGKPRKDGFSRRQRKTREKPRECESSEILEAVNEYEEVEELAPCLRSPKRIAKDDHMQRAGKASEKRRKRESVELVISEIYQEEDSFCTSYLEEEFSGDIIKVSCAYTLHLRHFAPC